MASLVPTRTKRTIDQLRWVVNEIKKDPNAHNAIVNSWNPEYLYTMAQRKDTSYFPICHNMYQVNIIKKRLCLHLYQRSADIFLGVPFNIASYALLTIILAKVLGYKPGEFVHTFGDVHIYEKHLDQVKEQLRRKPRPFPTMKIDRKVKDIDDFLPEHALLGNYDPHPPIKAELSVTGGFGTLVVKRKEDNLIVMNFYPRIKKEDKEMYTALVGEEKRQAEGLELIPSENYVSRAVKEAMASSLTNKYSEGYPGKRYYGGQEFTDKVETLAINRAKKLFGAKYANVQPLGGANANIAMYFALLQPGDTVLGMDLSHGGHLTHGNPVTYLTKIFNFQRYKMKNIETGEIDYEDMRRVAKKIKPKIVLAGFSAYPRELNYKKFVDIAREVGAVSVMDAAHIAGLIAGKAAKNPFDYGFDIMTTTTHKTLRPRGGMILVRESEELAKKIDKAVFRDSRAVRICTR